MPSTPEITVVIPTLNRWSLLERALADVLGQQRVELEVIVVDDGSTDQTPARLAAHPDERVRTLRHDRPLGVARARNDGVAEARGEWIAFLDDDDLWAPDKLRLQLDAAAEAGASIAYASSIVIDEDRRVQGVDAAPGAAGVLRDLLRHNSIPGGCSNLIARTELVRAVGSFDEQLQQLADWDLWIRLTGAAPAVALPEVLVGYVDHPASMHVRDAAIAPRELAYLTAKHAELCARHGTQLGGGVWFLNWVAGGQHRAGDVRGAVKTYLIGARRYRSKGALLRAAVALVSDRLVVKDVVEPLSATHDVPAWLNAGGPTPAERLAT